MLSIVRAALRLTTQAFDTELQLLIDAALAELEMLGVPTSASAEDPQLQLAVIAYCKWQFGDNPDKEQWAAIYRDKLAMFQTSTEYALAEVRE